MALIKCPECNHEVSDTAKFCPNCGFNILAMQKEKIICKDCGAEVPDDVDACPNCGRPLVNVWKKISNACAIISCALSIGGLMSFYIARGFIAIISVVFGIVALNSGTEKKGIAWTGIAMSIINILTYGVMDWYLS